jgi:Flp pilus assembly pilin Flp
MTTPAEIAARAAVRQDLCNAAAYEPDPRKFAILRALIRELRTDRAAVTSLEYGIIAGVLGLVLLASMHSFSGHLSTLFSTIGRSI